MTLTSAALTTLARANAELGTSGEDAYIEQLIEAVSERIAKYCGRVLHYSDAQEDTIPGYGDTFLVVSRPPIEEITSIEYNSSEIDSSNYIIDDADAGLIYSERGWTWTALRSACLVGADKLVGTENPLYVVVYKGGYITPQQDADGVGTRDLPYDLEDAAIEAITYRYRRKGKDPSIVSEKLLGSGVTYASHSDLDASGFPPHVRSVLDTYKHWGIGV
jgi:hypothetical protein